METERFALRSALIAAHLCERIVKVEYSLDSTVRAELNRCISEFNNGMRSVLSRILTEDKLDDKPGGNGLGGTKRETTEQTNVVRDLLYPDVQFESSIGLIAPEFKHFIGPARHLISTFIGRITSKDPRWELRKERVSQRRLIDLAIFFENADFIAHPACYQVVQEVWRGHHPFCGRLMLTKFPSLIERSLLLIGLPTILPARMNPFPFKLNPANLRDRAWACSSTGKTQREPNGNDLRSRVRSRATGQQRGVRRRR